MWAQWDILILIRNTTWCCSGQILRISCSYAIVRRPAGPDIECDVDLTVTETDSTQHTLVTCRILPMNLRQKKISMLTKSAEWQMLSLSLSQTVTDKIFFSWFFLWKLRPLPPSEKRSKRSPSLELEISKIHAFSSVFLTLNITLTANYFPQLFFQEN